MGSEPELPSVLLGLARDDLLAARTLLPVAQVADSILGFHAQQAVEKALKAALASRGVEFPYTHDLFGLMELCTRSGLELPDALSDADRLSPYGVHLRYGSLHASTLDRVEALSWAETAISWAQGVVDGVER
jgi:HEPN domain-containing protein